MKKFALILIVLMLLAPLAVTALEVVQRFDFNTMGGWRVGHGDWMVRGGRLVQNDPTNLLARIDAQIPQQGVYQIDFDVRYLDGGYRSEQDFRRGHYHGGFGIHIGVDNPPLGRMAWGNGRSYLLWLNLDTRPQTMSSFPHHYGFRAQVYESRSNIGMDLYRHPLARQLLGDERVTVDIIFALRQQGIDLTVADLEPFLARDVPVSIRVNTRTGEIGVKDPTAPIRYYFNVDPAVLSGRYISLRTNSLSLSFDNFVVTRL